MLAMVTRRRVAECRKDDIMWFSQRCREGAPIINYRSTGAPAKAASRSRCAEMRVQEEANLSIRRAAYQQVEALACAETVSPLDNCGGGVSLPRFSGQHVSSRLNRS